MSYDWQKQEQDGRKAVYTINLRPEELTEPGRCYNYEANHGVANDIPKLVIHSPDWITNLKPDPEQEVSFSIVVLRDKDWCLIPFLYIHTISGDDHYIELEDVVEKMPDIFISLQSIYNNRDDILHSLEKIVADALSYKSVLTIDIKPHDGLETVKLTFSSPHLETGATIEWSEIEKFFVEAAIRDLNEPCPEGSDDVQCDNCEHCTS